MTRRQYRENAFLLLFEASLRDDTPEELYAVAEEIEEITIDEHVKALVEGVLAHTEELDAVIAEFSKKRAVSRIARMNLILLRMAIYEILYSPKVPRNVAISEAVAISQKYTYMEDTKFINGLLGSYNRSLPAQTEVTEDA